MSKYQKYLDNLNTELNFYSQQLSFIKKQFKENTDDDFQNILDSLNHLWKEAKSAYSELESASQEEWEPLKKIASEAFSNLRSSFEDLLHDSSDMAQEYASQFREYSEERLKNLSEYIKENPFKSILIAAGLGFVLGRILK